jgi:hypothetical protein
MKEFGRGWNAWIALAGIGLLGWFSSSARAQEPGVEEGSGRRTTAAVRLEAQPVLDGEVLADPAWAGTVPASGFVQSAPDEGEPASERTEVRVGFDGDTLFIGVVCYDRDPSGIIVSERRRDVSLDESDSFAILLDTYLDRQSGFVFGTNPAGIEFDGQVTGETEGGLSAGNTFNRNWDAVWEVRTQVSELGWSAEFAIPFRTLRYATGANGRWGINFQRNIRRRNETSFWAPLSRQYNLYWVSGAGDLEGVEAPAQRNLKWIPYVLVESRREGVEGASTQSDFEAGLDVKYGVTQSLTLDATVNTDFAQVEADEQQINLDRFNLFFPEKRPFFLENAGLFSVGVDEELELFFSRRIGLGPNGEEIPIEGGLRLSGKAGANNLGLLYMRAEEASGVAPRNDFAVARYSRDLPNRSAIGAMFVGREGGGPLAPGDDTNSTFGLDGRWGIGEYGQVSGFVARTETPGITEDDHAYRLAARYDGESLVYSVGYTEVGEGFNPEVGFLRRRGYRKPDAFVLYRIRPENWWGLQELRPHVSYRGFWGFDDFQETGYLHVDNHWEWANGYELHTGVNFTREGVREAFEIVPGIVVPPGTYDHEDLQLVFFTNRGAPASFEMRVTAGGIFGGDRVALSPGVSLRAGEAFNGEIGWTNNDVDLPGGSFETNLGRLRLSYSFTPRVFVQALVQYNDRADRWATNLRFGRLQSANTGLFVVYDEVRDIGSAGTGIPDRSLIVKYSRLFDVLR